AQSLKNFCEAIGISKANSEIEIGYFEHFIRDYLNIHAERAMAVEKPLKVVITDFSGSEEEDFDVNPNDETAGTRKITMSKELYIEEDDFSLDPPPKYYRLKKDGYVRLKNAYIIKCDEVVFGENGEIKELRCSHVPSSRSGNDTSGIKVKGVIHWVDAATCVDAEIRKYDYLLKDAQYPGQDFSERMNQDSVHVFYGKAEPYLAGAKDGSSFQLMRKGYYKKVNDNGRLILSEIVSLKDTFNVKK
ncbi:MAG TPA: glutamine--tRNA ligase, partial [Clostridiales bacterium]|nr:glutamine--tRNA ligase [Clostridiales bacterium]